MSSTFDPRITAYFGDAMLRAGFMPLPHLFLRHYHALGIGHAEAMFVLQLMEINWDLAAPPRTVNDIAQRMGVNARTVRRYSETVAELGLITLYDQYDESGAQVENGYDLSPLFEQLAAFAPEPPLGGQTRRRERRAVEATVQESHVQNEGHSRARKHGPDKYVMVPPGRTVIPPPDKNSTPPPGRTVMPTPDTTIRPPMIDSPGLKKEKRIHKEQKNMMHDASVQNSPVAGWSLRSHQELTSDDVVQTGDILQRAGIDLPVRSRIQTSLTPAEAWGLWVYALAKCWSVPLLISEVYDKALRCARPSSVPKQYDDVGAALVRLAPDLAEQIVHAVIDSCSGPNVGSVVDVGSEQDDPAVVTAVEKVRQLVVDVRKLSIPRVPSTSEAKSIQAAHVLTWTVVLERLAAKIDPPDFSTWLQDTALLEVEPECAIIGAGNIFARDRIEATYLGTIQQTLSDVLGRPMEVQIVIGPASRW